MAWSYLSRIFSFSGYGKDGLGNPSSKSDTESPSASQSFLAESPALLPPTAGSNAARQSDSEVANDTGEAPNESPESNLAESALGFLNHIVVDLDRPPESILAESESEVPNDIVEGFNEPTEPIFSESAPKILDDILEGLDEAPESILAESTPEISSDIVEVLNESPIFDLAETASEIPDVIVHAVNRSPKSDPAEPLPASQPSLANSRIEDVVSRESDTGLSSALLPPVTIYESREPNISQVSLLIRTARKPGHKIALKMVKTLYNKAVRTVRKKQTPAQIYLIDNWDSHSARSRRSSNFSLHSTADPPSQPEAAQSSSLSLSFPKISVDASAHGIGFIFNDRWLAWTFTAGHPDIPRGPNNKIIISWGELVAVELGILTLLSCGYRDMKVLVRSDNSEVVDALTKGTPKPNYGLDIVLARIRDMCNKAGLELEMELIPGKENLADGPSRGEYPPHDLMLDHSPQIPQQLQGLVIQVEVV